ncbi:hypothetical protein CRUP_009150 [Coryphaenoides rupestris]|nr:hypothetical protein CRUP_009150 [Coryphaenoides rupestris]
MIDWPNGTVASLLAPPPGPEELQRSKCVLGFIPVVYYSALLCVGVPEELQRSKCVLGFIPVVYYSALLCVGVPVNILTAVVLSRLACRTKKTLYYYLLAVTGSDILTQLFIIFVGFLLETAVFHRQVPALLLHSVSAAEFAANHASIWSTVPLTVDRYVALCHPLLHRQISYPARARRIIAGVLALSLASGVPFFWWSDVWRSSGPPSTLDAALIWTHVTIIYFLPCSIFLVLNSLIIRTLRASHRPQQEQAVTAAVGAGGGLEDPGPQQQSPAPQHHQQQQQQQQRRRRLGKTTVMLLAITSVFSMLWAPRTVVVIYHLYVSSVHRDWRVHLAFDLANMLAMLNTARQLLPVLLRQRALPRHRARRAAAALGPLGGVGAVWVGAGAAAGPAPPAGPRPRLRLLAVQRETQAVPAGRRWTAVHTRGQPCRVTAETPPHPMAP